MKHRKKIRTLLCAALAAVMLAAFAAMADGGAGSESDPLVTLSYLTNTFTTQVMEEVDGLLARRNEALRKELGGQQSSGGSGEAYTAVALAPGQTLRGEAGCEVLLRSGSARCGDTGPLTDTTSGGELDGGAALAANHLYLFPESRSLRSSGGAALLVRGRFTVE